MSIYDRLKKNAPNNAWIELLTQYSECINPQGLLTGTPFAVQNNICVAGARLTCGSQSLSSYISPYSATAVEWLRAAGAIPVCTTNLAEFGVDHADAANIYGNPANSTRSSHHPISGCATGAAALVAADCVPLALASDTGGGTRMAAANFSVIGMKPSYGAFSRYGLAAFSPSLEQISLLGKDLSLLRAAHRCLSSRQDPLDSTHTALPSMDSVFDNLHANISLSFDENFPEDHEISLAISKSGELLESRGCSLHHVKPPLDLVSSTYYIISCAELSASLARLTPMLLSGIPSQDNWISNYKKFRSQMGSEIKKRIAMGAYFLQKKNYKSYYLKAQTTKRLICSWFSKLFQTQQLLILPVYPSIVSYDIDTQRELDVNAFTALANLAGLPAISIPFEKDSLGRPLAVQCIAPHGKDEWLFDVAEILLDQ